MPLLADPRPVSGGSRREFATLGTSPTVRRTRYELAHGGTWPRAWLASGHHRAGGRLFSGHREVFGKARQGTAPISSR